MSCRIFAALETPSGNLVLRNTIAVREWLKSPKGCASLRDGFAVDAIATRCCIFPIAPDQRFDRCLEDPLRFTAADGTDNATLERSFSTNLYFLSHAAAGVSERLSI